MGILRLFLALGVVRDHRVFFDSCFFIKGGVAVILFYVISGFYMSLVISERYQPSGPRWEWRFLGQRALRLYPAYWFMLLLALIFSHTADRRSPLTDDIGLTALQHAGALLSDLFLFGLDVQVSTNTLVHPSASGYNFMWDYYPVFQAWTVAIELTFYVFAAFFALRDKRSAAVALAIGIYVRAYFCIANGKLIGLSHDGIGLSNTPWGYHFFPVDLIFFMLGWTSYRLYLRLRLIVETYPAYFFIIRCGAVFFAISLFGLSWWFDAFMEIADYNDYRIWVALPVFVTSIPFLFLVTKESRADGFIGQYSYPVYLCHITATDIASRVFGLPFTNKWTTTISVAVLSTLIVFGIELPIERFRHKLGRKSLTKVPVTA